MTEQDTAQANRDAPHRAQVDRDERRPDAPDTAGPGLASGVGRHGAWHRVRLWLAVVLGLAAVVALYAPALGGGLYYDDYNALDAMAEIESVADAWAFVTGGTAGPLGRPIALASYLPHAADWPASSRGILAVNVAIHALNAALLGWLAWLLLRLRGIGALRAGWIALGAALLWAVMPLIASASLIVIQRMTTLASTFMLLGLVGFVAGYALRATRPWWALMLQFGALGLGTLLGLFTKETAALAMVFALVIDTTLMRHRRFAAVLPRWLAAAALWGALALLLWYLSPLRIDWWAEYVNRGWTPWERLQYQVVVLWEYLRLAVAPLPTAFGPFHDWRRLSDVAAWQSALAASAWVVAAAAAWWLQWRHGNPWPLFALAWFWAGHLLESTTLSLELVFEHRNYLAVFGLALALAVAAAQAPPKLARIAPMLFGLFIAIQAASLYAMTTLWGDRALAAEQWAERYPGSYRAAMHAATLMVGSTDDHIAELNRQIISAERLRHAIAILDRTSRACATCADVRLQALILSCFVESPEQRVARFAALRELLADTGSVNRSVTDGFFRLQTAANGGDCAPLANTDVVALARAVIERPATNARGHEGPIRIEPGLRAQILFVAARAEYESGRLNEALTWLAEGERVAPTALPVLQFQVYLLEQLFELGESGAAEAAREAIERRRPLDRRDGVMTDAALDALVAEVRSWGGGDHRGRLDLGNDSGGVFE